MDKIVLIVFILIGAIQLIILIVFFVMASNVSKIKKEITNTISINGMIEKAIEEKYAGNNILAKELLLKAEYRLKKEEEYTKEAYAGSSQLGPQLEPINMKKNRIDNLLKDFD